MGLQRVEHDRATELNGGIFRIFPGGSDGKESACNAGDQGSIPGCGRSPEKGMATHSSILAWRIPWTEEPGGLHSVGPKESDTTEGLTEGSSSFLPKSPKRVVSYYVPPAHFKVDI